MTNDELRALADALDDCDPPYYESSPQINRSLDACIAKAADYLRAQADAQPVAWRDHVEQRIRGWRQRTMNRSGDRLALDDMMGQDTIDDLIDYVCDEWSDPAPAAPQAEPMADSDADYWLRNRQPILDAIERAGFMLMSNASGFWLHPRGKIDAQAEQKRELARALAAEANKCCHRSDGWEEHLAGRFQHILTLHRPKE